MHRFRGLALLGVALVGCGSRPETDFVTHPTDSRMPPITISEETTFVTEPLLPDGTPDYAAFLNERNGAGVTRENNGAVLLAPVLSMELEDEVFESMGVDAEHARSAPRLTRSTLWEDFDEHWRATGSSESKLSSCARREMYDAFLDERPWDERRGPCSARDCPLAEAWVKANRAPLAIIEEATRRPRYFIPKVEGRNLASPSSTTTMRESRISNDENEPWRSSG